MVKSRLEFQRCLLLNGNTRFSPIIVTREGIVYDGNHAVRAAAEEARTVDVDVIETPAMGFGAILGLPIG